eukprot:726357-Rhodomonas_salina.1
MRPGDHRARDSGQRQDRTGGAGARRAALVEARPDGGGGPRGAGLRRAEGRDPGRVPAADGEQRADDGEPGQDPGAHERDPGGAVRAVQDACGAALQHGARQDQVPRAARRAAAVQADALEAAQEQGRAADPLLRGAHARRGHPGAPHVQPRALEVAPGRAQGPERGPAARPPQPAAGAPRRLHLARAHPAQASGQGRHGHDVGAGLQHGRVHLLGPRRAGALAPPHRPHQ